MVKIEAKPLVYDHDSRSDSSCSEDDLQALASYSDTRDIELNPETHETLERNLRTKKELTGIRLRHGTWFQTLGFHRGRYPRRVSHDDGHHSP